MVLLVYAGWRRLCLGLFVGLVKLLVLLVDGFC